MNSLKKPLNMDMQKWIAHAPFAGVMHWAVTTGGFNSETVQDVMPGRWNAASATSFRRLQWSG